MMMQKGQLLTKYTQKHITKFWDCILWKSNTSVDDASSCTLFDFTCLQLYSVWLYMPPAVLCLTLHASSCTLFDFTYLQLYSVWLYMPHSWFWYAIDLQCVKFQRLCNKYNFKLACGNWQKCNIFFVLFFIITEQTTNNYGLKSVTIKVKLKFFKILRHLRLHVSLMVRLQH